MNSSIIVSTSAFMNKSVRMEFCGQIGMLNSKLYLKIWKDLVANIGPLGEVAIVNAPNAVIAVRHVDRTVEIRIQTASFRRGNVPIPKHLTTLNFWPRTDSQS